MYSPRNIIETHKQYEYVKKTIPIESEHLTKLVLNYLNSCLWDMNQNSLCYTPNLCFNSWNDFKQNQMLYEGSYILHFCWDTMKTSNCIYLVGISAQMVYVTKIPVQRSEHNEIYEFIAEYEYDPTLRYYLHIMCTVTSITVV